MSVATTFSVIANGCALADFGERRLLIDPWCVGDLYRGAWSCYPTPRHADRFLAQATDCFISHIHEDHCDPQTLARLPKTLRMLLPDRYPNHVLRRKVEAAGFANVVMIPEGEPFAFADGIRLTVVPPLNTFGQELDVNRGLEEFVAAIDTGLVIERDQGARTGRYLLLADNTPYDLDRFLALFPDKPFDLAFFPYNGFADDYPLCYDNLGRDEKAALSLKRSLAREATMAAFAAKVAVRGFVPYSSDFAINGPRQAEFFDIHPPEFLHKDLYAQRFSGLAGVPAYALYEDDRLVCDERGTKYLRQSSDADRRHFTPKPDALQLTGLLAPELLAAAVEPRTLLAVLQAAAGNMFAKSAGSLDRIAPWQLHLEIEGIGLYRLDFARREVAMGAPATDGERLVLSIGAELLLAHMARTIHWNNSTIGCYLTWRRLPNAYNAFLYSALNYFHLPIGTTLEGCVATAG
jgi:L-ascorbate metabolism protein UlaG (beta-lactamase superfamily)